MSSQAAPPSDLQAVLQSLAQRLRQRGQRLATAESCTGGLIAAACTDLPGSSDWFERGFVTYSNEAKTDLLGVDAALIAAYGAVSEPVVRAMAEGALRRSRADWAVAVTGIAGPGGGSAAKPVGTVWLSWAWREPESAGQPSGMGAAAPIMVEAVCRLFAGGRAAVRSQTVEASLQGLLDRQMRGSVGACAPD